MPSPFSGMDPFLEHPEIFSDFHDSFLAYLRESIQPQLPPPYVAVLGRRASIEVSERFIGHEVQIAHTPSREARAASAVAMAPGLRTESLVIHVPNGYHDGVPDDFKTTNRREGDVRTAKQTSAAWGLLPSVAALWRCFA